MCCKKKKNNQTKFLFQHRLNMKPECMGLVTKKWLIKPKKLKEPWIVLDNLSSSSAAKAGIEHAS